jgi:probable rRNA maturation factor
MRSLNRRAFGRNRVTDVIAFPLRHGERLVGDVYVSPAAARQSAASLGIASREEELRLIVHGVLHVLGFDHPGGRSRQGSAMWRRQEQYVRQLTRRDA